MHPRRGRRPDVPLSPLRYALDIPFAAYGGNNPSTADAVPLSCRDGRPPPFGFPACSGSHPFVAFATFPLTGEFPNRGYLYTREAFLVISYIIISRIL